MSFQADLCVCDCSYLSSFFSLFFFLCPCIFTRAQSVVPKWFRGVFSALCWCEDRCRAVCLGAKINSNVKWQSYSLRVGTCRLPPPSPLTTALRSMALSSTHYIPVHYPSNTCMCVSAHTSDCAACVPDTF